MKFDFKGIWVEWTQWGFCCAGSKFIRAHFWSLLVWGSPQEPGGWGGLSCWQSRDRKVCRQWDGGGRVRLPGEVCQTQFQELELEGERADSPPKCWGRKDGTFPAVECGLLSMGMGSPGWGPGSSSSRPMHRARAGTWSLQTKEECRFFLLGWYNSA